MAAVPKQLLEAVEQAARRTNGASEQREPSAEPVSPLEIPPASSWAAEPAPAPRDWVIDGLIPAGRVTSFLGDGGTGKTTIAVQIGVHTAMSRRLYGLEVRGGPVLGIFCEDELDEIKRRTRAACEAESIALESLDQVHFESRDGHDNLLCTFDHDHIVLTPFYERLEATVESIRARLVMLDTAADLFAGDFMSTPHVRQFLKVALGGLCVRYGCAILLLAHPSASGMANGGGGGFSTAWNNSVRSRLYLRRPKSEDDPESAKDRRVLELKKANYGPDGSTVPLIFSRGVFVPDDNPIIDGAGPIAKAKPVTRLALAAMAHFRERARAGQVVSFKAIFEPLQASGVIERGNYETVRKPLQRTLKQLVDEGLLRQSDVPRGYRLRLTEGE
jgi:RecA-family ATPase